MKKFTIVGMVLWMMSFGMLFSQTGYYQDFEQPSGLWLDEESNNYSVTEADGHSTISVLKQAPWQSVGYSLDGSYDFSDSPYASFKVKSNVPFQFHFYLVSGSQNIMRTIRVYPSDEWVQYFMDFSDYEDFNMSDVSTLLVAANGTSIGWEGTFMFDDLRLGDEVTKMANLTGIDDQHFGDGMENNIVRVIDVANATGFTFEGGESLIENVTLSPVVEGVVTIRFDTKADVSGTETITVTAIGAPGFENNSTTFDLSVSVNNPPEIDGDLPAVETGVGKTVVVPLSGITDGNPESDQMIMLSASSDNQTVLPDTNMYFDYLQGSTEAALYLETADAGSGVNVTITVYDDGEGDDSTQTSFVVNSYAQFNEFPTVDRIEDQKINIQNGLYTLPLTGISDGNEGSQTLTFTATSSNPAVLPDDSIRVVDYSGGNTATLEMNPVETGTAIVTLEIADDAAGTDNEPLSIEQVFEVEVSFPLPTGKTISFQGDVNEDLQRGLWSLHDGQGGKFTISYVDSGSFNAMEVVSNDKFYWDGFNLNFTADTALDLSENPYLSMEVYSVNDATLHWIWFYDNTGTRNNVTNRDPENMFWAPAGEWTDIRFDFSQENDLLNKDTGEPINISNITRVLFNMHNEDFNWPPPGNYNGTFYIRNLRVGSDALKPEFTPMGTIDPVSDVTLFEDAGTQEITLTGITDGGDGTNTPVVTATSSNPSFIPDPAVSAVASETATLTYNPAAVADTATIELTVTADEADPNVITFFVKSFSNDASGGAEIAVDMEQRYQQIHGFGTYMNIPSLSQYYVEEMGASAMRIGLINNQLEVVNDNDDPYSIDRSKLNYNAFNWDYFRDLKERGVETFILTSWSPPAWMKQNLATDWSRAQAPDYNQTNNQLEEFLYEEFAESMVIAIKLFKEEAGIDIKAVGPQNEPAFNEPYPSAILSPEYFAKLVAVIGKRFDEEGLDTKIFMPEQVFSQQHYSMSEYMNAVQANPDANKHTDVIAVHGYASDGIGSGAPNFSQWTSMYNEAQEGEYPKELWMTETFRGYETYEDAMWIATAIYGSLEYGNIGLWTQWAFEGQHIQNTQPTQMLYACSNFFKFIRPGATRVHTSSGNAELLATSYVHEADGSFTTVVINQSDEAHKAYISGEGLPEQFQMYRTSRYEQGVDMGMTGDSVILFPPQSVTTLYASGNNAPTIHPVENMTLLQDAPEQVIDLMGITDGDDELDQNVTLNVSSSNTTLIPDPTLSAITNGEAILTFQPVAGQTGTSTITVSAVDDGTGFGFNKKEMSFDVHVYSSVNNDPYFDVIYDHFIKEDAGQQTITVTGVTDGDDESQTVTGVATSDNSQLLSSVSFTNNNDGTGTLTFTPEAEIHGEAIVRLTVMDNGGNDSNNGDQSYDQTFKVMVAAVNDAPTADPVDNQTVGSNSDVQTVTVSGITDGEAFGETQNKSVSAYSMDPSLVTVSDVTYSNGSVADINYQAVQDQVGTTSIKVVVKDDGGVANGGTDTVVVEFDVEVVPGNINNAPTINEVSDIQIPLAEGVYSLTIEGVSDGDEGSQNLTVTATSSDEDVVAAPVINYVNGWSFIAMNLTPLQKGTSTITVTLKDDGGVEYGGVDSVQVSFVATVTGTSGIDDVSISLNAYPNPATDLLNVKLPADHQYNTYTLYDLSGKIILLRRVTSGKKLLEIGTGNISAGEYVLVLTGKTKTTRLNVIIER